MRFEGKVNSVRLIGAGFILGQITFRRNPFGIFLGDFVECQSTSVSILWHFSTADLEYPLDKHIGTIFLSKKFGTNL